MRQELEYLCIDIRPGTEFKLTKIRELEQKITNLTRETDDLRTRVRELEN